MSIPRIQARIPAARVVSRAMLYGHELRFHKRSADGSAKCDIYLTGLDSDVIYGVVFEISESDKHTLDRIEGLGHGYDHKRVSVTDDSGAVINAISYFATDLDKHLKPYHWYKQHVLYGARQNSLPQVYIEKINRIDSIADPDGMRQLREMAIYKNV